MKSDPVKVNPNYTSKDLLKAKSVYDAEHGQGSFELLALRKQRALAKDERYHREFSDLSAAIMTVRPTQGNKMTTSTRKSAKTTGTWSADTIAIWRSGPKTEYRAQVSTAPDGKKFAAVRQVVLKADGTELPTKSGISLLISDSTPSDLRELSTLFRDLAVQLEGKSRKPKAGVKSSSEDTPTKVYRVKETESEKYVARIDEDGDVTCTSQKGKAMTFGSALAARKAIKSTGSEHSEYKVVASST